MGGLFGGGKNNATTTPVIASLQYQTSQYGAVIPVVHGFCRIPANLADYTDFTAIASTTTQKTGKGGGGSSQTSTSYTYTANVILAICEGGQSGISQFVSAYRDKEVLTPSTWSFTTYLGSQSQVPWPVMQTKHPERAVGYGGVAYVAVAACDLGSSATLKNHSFAVLGPASTLSASGGGQRASGPAVIQDILTNSDNGMGWTSARINAAGIADCILYTEAAGLLVCSAFQDAKISAAHLQDVLDACNLTCIWSGGQLVFKPLGDTSIGAWIAPSTPLYNLGDDDYIVSSPDEDPVLMKLRPLADSPNKIQVEFINTTNNFAPEVAEAEDRGDIDRYGLRTAPSKKLSMIPDPGTARRVAQLHLQRGLYVRRTFEFKLGWVYGLLEPMDLLNLNSTSLGLVNRTVRVRELEEDEEGTIKIIAEDWPFGIATATAYTNPGGGGGGVDQNIAPGGVLGSYLFEPPLDVTGGQRQVWVAAYGGPNWGGCQVHVSRDGTTYQQVGEIHAKARLGATTSALGASASTDDPLSVLSVDIGASGGVLLGASNLDASKYQTLSLVGYPSGAYELLSYRNANLTSAGRYDLDGLLKRGLYGTSRAGHAAGQVFLRLDDATAAVILDRWDTGVTVYFKLPSFNTFRNRTESLAAIAAIPYVVTTGAPVWPSTSGTTIAISTTPPV